MAMEGSLALPLFLFFIMTVLLSLEVVRFQSDMAQALHQAGSKMSVQAYQIREKSGQNVDVENEIKTYLCSQKLPYLCVKGKEKGVSIKDGTKGENGMIEIHAEYQLAPFIWWLPMGNIVLEDQFLGHEWTGYCGLEGQWERQEPEVYVYITETGSKYHMSLECSYLKVQISMVDAEWLTTGRNQWGGKYYSCEKCHAKETGNVYVTQDGNRYHSLGDCSALKRTVYLILLREAEGYSCCSRCGG